MKKVIVLTIATMVFGLFLSSCALVEMSGTMTRRTGEAMESFSTQHDSFLGKAAGFGGRINKTVGSSVEDIARKNEPGMHGEIRTE